MSAAGSLRKPVVMTQAAGLSIPGSRALTVTSTPVFAAGNQEGRKQDGRLWASQAVRWKRLSTEGPPFEAENAAAFRDACSIRGGGANTLGHMRPEYRTVPGWIVGTFLAVAGCSRAGSPAVEVDDEFHRVAEEYMRETGARPITAADLARRIEDDETIVLLDIREPAEHAVSALRGAILLPPDLVSTQPLELPPDATVVAYCTAGYRSGVAAVALEQRFGREVLNLEGGIISWFNRGGLVVDASDEPVDHVHPYGPAWKKYVHTR